MRALRGVVSLAWAIAVLDCCPGTLAQAQQDNGIWGRLRRAVGRGGDDVAEPPYSLYGGPVAEAKYYSYPYGYPPYPPPEPPTSTIPTHFEHYAQFVLSNQYILPRIVFAAVVDIRGFDCRAKWKQHGCWQLHCAAVTVFGRLICAFLYIWKQFGHIWNKHNIYAIGRVDDRSIHLHKLVYFFRQSHRHGRHRDSHFRAVLKHGNTRTPVFGRTHILELYNLGNRSIGYTQHGHFHSFDFHIGLSFVCSIPNYEREHVGYGYRGIVARDWSFTYWTSLFWCNFHKLIKYFIPDKPSQLTSSYNFRPNRAKQRVADIGFHSNTAFARLPNYVFFQQRHINLWSHGYISQCNLPIGHRSGDPDHGSFIYPYYIPTKKLDDQCLIPIEFWDKPEWCRADRGEHFFCPVPNYQRNQHSQFYWVWSIKFWKHWCHSDRIHRSCPLPDPQFHTRSRTNRHRKYTYFHNSRFWRFDKSTSLRDFRSLPDPKLYRFDFDRHRKHWVHNTFC
ncbi:hypothetical protein B0T16DRAFT_451920 [Cercophora newfieldiana]|uniref:Uncharacterized protein n=1 Tax=Cercophora newfieldiana TaxID=92897 RepID=A0AA39YPL7_9PEZI|nr:hypothetical protein B0T16DRAFT_451920 [Cercophora newfieldiana]